jgi:hypothetical protein
MVTPMATRAHGGPPVSFADVWLMWTDPHSSAVGRVRLARAATDPRRSRWQEAVSAVPAGSFLQQPATGSRAPLGDVDSSDSSPYGEGGRRQ